MRKTELAWAAGFFDGEGCIHIGRLTARGHTNYQLIIRVSQRTREPVDEFQRLFGGFVSTTRASSHPHKTQWLWGCSNAQAGKVLAQLLPFLIVKKSQAELAVEFQALRSERKANTDPETGRFLVIDKSGYQEYYEQMRALKEVS